MSLLKRKKKPLVFTVHGFGRNRSHEFDSLATYLKKKKYEVVQFDMYDIKDANDANYKEWIKKAENALEHAMKKNNNIIILGFSMGGVIASYLASVFKVHSLILCAPAFEYLDLSKVTNLFKKSDQPGPSSKQYQTFTKIVSQYKESISHVDCPVLFIHGANDEVISYSSSAHAYKKIKHDKKRLIYLEGAKHRFLYDGKMEHTAFVIIEKMLEDDLF
jgi:esterase/lipase